MTDPTIERRAAVLVLHQGPFFNGVDERCGCGHPVASGEEWARHAAEAEVAAS